MVARLRKELSEAEKDSSKGRHRARQRAVKESLANLLPGDVVEVPGPRRLGTVVVVFPAGNPANPRVGVITQQAQLRRRELQKELARLAVEVDGKVEPVLDDLVAKLPEDLQPLAAQARAAALSARRALLGQSR